MRKFKHDTTHLIFDVSLDSTEPYFNPINAEIWKLPTYKQQHDYVVEYAKKLKEVKKLTITHCLREVQKVYPFLLPIENRIRTEVYALEPRKPKRTFNRY